MKTLLSTLLLAAAATSSAQDTHHNEVNKNGDAVMGFSHEKTTHHFLLYKDGGAIEVTAKDAKDNTSRDQIRMHLGHIAQMFADGNFRAPMLVHSKTPPGVLALERLKSQIDYRFETLEQGGRVRITTRNPEALQALHEFLRFQIADHNTGDSGRVDGAR